MLVPYPYALAPTDFVRQGRDDLEQVADHEQVGEFADRGIRIAVDGDDVLGRLHADTMLDRPADAGTDVERRLDDLAGLADLELVRDPARVGGRSRGAHRAAERRGQLAQRAEALLASDPASAGDDDRRLLEVDDLGLRRVALGDGRLREGRLLGGRGRRHLGRAAPAPRTA